MVEKTTSKLHKEGMTRGGGGGGGEVQAEVIFISNIKKQQPTIIDPFRLANNQ